MSPGGQHWIPGTGWPDSVSCGPMTDPAARTATRAKRPAELERRAGRIASGRYVVVSVSLALLALALIAAVLMRIIDPTAMPSMGIALWWAVQTFATVGYGDVVPETTAGRIVAGAVMVFGITFLSFLTATVTSVLIEGQRRARPADDAAGSADLSQVMAGIARLEARLEQLEKRLPGDD